MGPREEEEEEEGPVALLLSRFELFFDRRSFLPSFFPEVRRSVEWGFGTTLDPVPPVLFFALEETLRASIVRSFLRSFRRAALFWIKVPRVRRCASNGVS